MTFAFPTFRLAALLFSLLGKLFQRRDNDAAALFCYREASNYSPKNAKLSFSHGSILLKTGDFKGAIAAFNTALITQPIYPEVQNSLGIALHREGNFSEAIACYQQALIGRPNFAAPLNNLGNVHFVQGRVAEALEYYQKALAVDPCYVEALSNTAMVMHSLKNYEEAEKFCRNAIDVDPGYASAHNNLGNALRGQGRLEEALASFEFAMQLAPGMIEAKINIANLTGNVGFFIEAIPHYENELKLDPEAFQLHFNLGRALDFANRREEGRLHLEEALRIRPDSLEALSALSTNSAFQGDVLGAIDNCRRVLAVANSLQVHQNYLFFLNYLPEMHPSDRFAAHVKWGDGMIAALDGDQALHRNSRNPGRRLRIGYVSGDFRLHSVASFIEPILRQHDKAAFEVHCFANVGEPDAVTARLHGLSDCWHNIFLKSTAVIVELVRANEIDILIDLAGHSSGNSLPVFAWKAAPVQVSYLGYPNTTGLRTMDYRITDAYADPPDLSEAYHCEKLLRLPGSFLLYQKPDLSPDVSSCPFIKNDYITFGSFNNVAKVNASVIALWSKILLAVPRSRLILKGFAFANMATKNRIQSLFLLAGITADRVDLFDFIPDKSGHLGLYGKIDIALDPFPYNGTTTTCESLWMGVPIVVLAGNAHVARVGVSLMSNVGLEEFIAESEDEYLNIAKNFAHDVDRLQVLRRILREKVQGSPLMNAAGFTQNLEAAYRKIWRDYSTESEFNFTSSRDTLRA